METHSHPNAQSSTAQENDATKLLNELVDHLRSNRRVLTEEWIGRVASAELLDAMTSEEIFSELTAVYDNYVDALETGSVETLQAYARDLCDACSGRSLRRTRMWGAARARALA